MIASLRHERARAGLARFAGRRWRGAPLPGASSKLEGGLDEPIGAGSTQGRLTLGSDRFFDGRAFDPDDIETYLSDLP